MNRYTTLFPMAETDLHAVCAIENKAFPEPWNRQMFATELTAPGANNLVTRETNGPGKNGITGYACFRVYVEQMHLLRIAVDQDKARSGLGTWILGSCLERAQKKGAKEAFLEVRESNEPAVLFYEKSGFFLTAKRLQYYPDTGEAALVMKRDLAL